MDIQAYQNIFRKEVQLCHFSFGVSVNALRTTDSSFAKHELRERFSKALVGVLDPFPQQENRQDAPPDQSIDGLTLLRRSIQLPIDAPNKDEKKPLYFQSILPTQARVTLVVNISKPTGPGKQGDVDNYLKTVLDGLRCPDNKNQFQKMRLDRNNLKMGTGNSELNIEIQNKKDDDPLVYCLLGDDRAIDDLHIRRLEHSGENWSINVECKAYIKANLQSKTLAIDEKAINLGD